MHHDASSTSQDIAPSAETLLMRGGVLSHALPLEAGAVKEVICSLRKLLVLLALFFRHRERAALSWSSLVAGC